ncbi:MAG: hypothetical protein EOP53_18205 [Sphingobacteriales bacterium]|nr:MAG: hypothetical protein EOP53_18205 [Sphingobacteriales bacterium]
MFKIILKKIGIITVSDVEVYKEKLFFSIRLPRVFLGILVGFALSISGAILQGLFKNPLSDPSLIGTSSGAVAAVVIFIILGTKIAALKWLGATLGIFALPV